MSVGWNSNFGLGLFDVNANFEADKAWVGFGQDDGGYTFVVTSCSRSRTAYLDDSPEGTWYRARLFYDAVRGASLATVRDVDGRIEYVTVLEDDTCPELPCLGISSVGATRSGAVADGLIDNVILRALPD